MPCIHRLEWMLICQPGKIMRVLLSSNFPWLFTVGGCFSIRVSLPSLEIFPIESLRCFLLASSTSLSLLHLPPPTLPTKLMPSITISVSAVHEGDTIWIFSKLHVLKSKNLQWQTEGEINHLVIYSEQYWRSLLILGKGKESCLKFIINFINRCVLNFILNKKIF